MIVKGSVLTTMALILISHATAYSSDQPHPETDWATQTALTKMHQTPCYGDINAEIGNVLSEIKLERGNYAWGGYEAFRLLQTPQDIRLLYCDGGSLRSVELPPHEHRQLWSTLETLDIWNLDSSLTYPCDDCSTFFIRVRKENQQHEIVVYAPNLLAKEPDTAVYWEIIQAIEKLKQFIRKNLDSG